MSKLRRIINLILDVYRTIVISLIDKNKKFTYIYNSKYWKGMNDGSLSGAGSNENTTHRIKHELQKFFVENDIKSVLDIPCGDWKWMSTMNFENIDYVGCDVVTEMINHNKKLYEKNNIKFVVQNLLKDDLPRADMIIVRDLLVHLDNSDIRQCLNNIKKANFKYIAITNYPLLKSQLRDKFLGDKWRPINLNINPFNLPKSDYNLDDTSNVQDHDKDKYLSIWLRENFIKYKD